MHFPEVTEQRHFRWLWHVPRMDDGKVSKDIHTEKVQQAGGVGWGWIVKYADLKRLVQLENTFKSRSKCGVTDFMKYEATSWTASPPRSWDAEIKVSSDENTELRGSSFKGWSRSVYCYA